MIIRGRSVRFRGRVVLVPWLGTWDESWGPWLRLCRKRTRRGYWTPFCHLYWSYWPKRLTGFWADFPDSMRVLRTRHGFSLGPLGSLRAWWAGVHATCVARGHAVVQEAWWKDGGSRFKKSCYRCGKVLEEGKGGIQ